MTLEIENGLCYIKHYASEQNSIENSVHEADGKAGLAIIASKV